MGGLKRSRLQVATATFCHLLFVPLTMELSSLIASLREGMG